MHCWNLFQQWEWSQRTNPVHYVREKEVTRMKITVSAQIIPSTSIAKAV